MRTSNLPPKRDLFDVLHNLKQNIREDYRCSLAEDSDKKPSMDVTIFWNSATGDWDFLEPADGFTRPAAAGFRVWIVAYLTRTTNCYDLACQIQGRLLEREVQQGCPTQDRGRQ